MKLRFEFVTWLFISIVFAFFNVFNFDFSTKVLSFIRPKTTKMKIVLALAILLGIAACGSDEDKNETSNVNSETMEELEEVQDDNVQLEEFDGQLDSLINEFE